jgi:uncharacterized protein (DUF1810 family)
MSCEFDLQRFHWAQDGVIEQARRQLQAGEKTSHWMWFIFPQVAGLGRSGTAQRYAIASAGEARAYLADPVLGSRLRECCELLLAHAGMSAESILGGIDALKLRSSATLFHAVSGEVIFQQVLDAFYGGEPDRATLDILGGVDN